MLALCVALCTSSAFPQDLKKGCAARHYSIRQLPLHPTSINTAGDVGGTSSSNRAAVWNVREGIREITVPAGFTNAEGVGINNHGHLVGIAINRTTNRRQGFFYGDGRLTLLSGEQARPFAINDTDEIAGEAIIDGKAASGAVVWRGSEVLSLGGCCGGVALGINNRGQVIGNIYDRQGEYKAILWDQVPEGRPFDLPDGFSSALVINQAGVAVVQSFLGGIMLYRDGKLSHVSPPRFPSHPNGLNSCGVMVGSFGLFGDADRAFLWDGTLGFQDLNSLVSAAPHWKLQVATGINDDGVIVGWGQHGEQEDAGFMLIPQE